MCVRNMSLLRSGRCQELKKKLLWRQLCKVLLNQIHKIQTSLKNLLSWRFHDWLGIIKSPSCESLKLFWFPELTSMTKSWKIVLACKIHKNDVIRLKLCQKVQLFISACNMNILTVLDFELLRKNNFMASFLSGL